MPVSLPVSPQPGPEQGPVLGSSRAGRADLLRVPAGFVSNNEKKWRELRRFTLSTLRDFGMGKSSMSHKVQQEAQHLVELLAKLRGDVAPVLAGPGQAEDTAEPQGTRVAPELRAGPGVGDPCRVGLSSSPVLELQGCAGGQEGDPAPNWCGGGHSRETGGTGMGRHSWDTAPVTRNYRGDFPLSNNTQLLPCQHIWGFLRCLCFPQPSSGRWMEEPPAREGSAVAAPVQSQGLTRGGRAVFCLEADK